MMITVMKNVKDTALVNATNSFILQVKHFKILKFNTRRPRVKNITYFVLIKTLFLMNK